MNDDDVDAAIAAYRCRLSRAAALEPADLDEIEDHLRALVGELRAEGRPAGAALAEAVRRLGEPDAVGRELARVRPVFGARLSRARAIGSAALLALLVGPGIVDLARGADRLLRFETLVLAGGLACVAALVARRTIGRAVALGFAAFVVPNSIFWFVASSTPATGQLGNLVGAAGLVALLAPWRPRELSRAGLALALATFGFPGIAWIPAVIGVSTMPYPTTTLVALVGFVLGLAGVALRARWGSLALGVAAVALLSAVRPPPGIALLGGTQSAFEMYRPLVIVASVVALLGAAALSWRTARGGIGRTHHRVA